MFRGRSIWLFRGGLLIFLLGRLQVWRCGGYSRLSLLFLGAG
jgi:hypothetical protein